MYWKPDFVVETKILLSVTAAILSNKIVETYLIETFKYVQIALEIHVLFT